MIQNWPVVADRWRALTLAVAHPQDLVKVSGEKDCVIPAPRRIYETVTKSRLRVKTRSPDLRRFMSALSLKADIAALTTEVSYGPISLKKACSKSL